MEKQKQIDTAAEYIDRKKVKHGLDRIAGIMDEIVQTPTADVVPRSVIAEIFNEIEKICVPSNLPTVKMDWERFTELRKKYKGEGK